MPPYSGTPKRFVDSSQIRIARKNNHIKVQMAGRTKIPSQSEGKKKKSWQQSGQTDDQTEKPQVRHVEGSP